MAFPDPAARVKLTVPAHALELSPPQRRVYFGMIALKPAWGGDSARYGCDVERSVIPEKSYGKIRSVGCETCRLTTYLLLPSL